MRIRFALALTILFAGISLAQETPSSASKDADKATVYVYRYKQFVGSALSPSVYCDEVELARMENGRYFTASIDSGHHSFRSNDKQSGVDLDLKAGQSYFIRVEIAAGMMKGHGRLTLTAPEQGVYEVTSDKLKPLDAGKVVDKNRVSVAEAHPELPAPPKAAAPAPTLQPVTAKSEEHALRGETIVDSNGALNPASASGDQVSLGDAARKARQKKEQPPK